MMSRSVDVKSEMRKIASSKPVHAVAGASVLASQTIRELPARFARWREEASGASLPSRASGYVTTVRTRAAQGYDKLADRGKHVLDGRVGLRGKASRNGKAK